LVFVVGLIGCHAVCTIRVCPTLDSVIATNPASGMTIGYIAHA